MSDRPRHQVFSKDSLVRVCSALDRCSDRIVRRQFEFLKAALLSELAHFGFYSTWKTMSFMAVSELDAVEIGVVMVAFAFVLGVAASNSSLSHHRSQSLFLGMVL